MRQPATGFFLYRLLSAPLKAPTCQHKAAKLSEGGRATYVIRLLDTAAPPPFVVLSRHTRVAISIVTQSGVGAEPTAQRLYVADTTGWREYPYFGVAYTAQIIGSVRTTPAAIPFSAL